MLKKKTIKLVGNLKPVDLLKFDKCEFLQQLFTANTQTARTKEQRHKKAGNTEYSVVPSPLRPDHLHAT